MPGRIGYRPSGLHSDVPRRVASETTWTDARGDTHEIAEMSVRYKANVIGWLLRHVDDLYNDFLAAVEYEELALEALRRSTPTAWLVATPLYQALARDVAQGRGGRIGED